MHHATTNNISIMDFTETIAMEQGSSYVLSPITLLSCLVTLVCGFVIMPVIGPRISSKYEQLKDDKKRFDTILGSSVHHVIVSPLAIYALASGALSNRVVSDSALGFALMQTSLGYFIGDTILFLCDPKMRWNAQYMCHHIIGIFGQALPLSVPGQLMFIPITFQVGEIAAFFINIQRAMSVIGVSKDSGTFKAITHIMTLAFFFTRIILIPWQWYEFIPFALDPASQVVSLYYKVLGCLQMAVFHLLFVYWFVLIVKKYYLKGGKQKSN